MHTTEPFRYPITISALEAFKGLVFVRDKDSSTPSATATEASDYEKHANQDEGAAGNQ